MSDLISISPFLKKTEDAWNITSVCLDVIKWILSIFYETPVIVTSSTAVIKGKEFIQDEQEKLNSLFKVSSSLLAIQEKDGFVERSEKLIESTLRRTVVPASDYAKMMFKINLQHKVIYRKVRHRRLVFK